VRFKVRLDEATGGFRWAEWLLARAGDWHIDQAAALLSVLLVQHSRLTLQLFRTPGGLVSVLTRPGEVLHMSSADGQRFEHAVSLG
jgi:hypothetical protein